MTYRSAIIAGASVFFLNALSLAFGWYKALPNIDAPLHLAGGFAVGLFALAILASLRRSKKLGAAPRWFDFLFTIGFVALVAVCWEWHEFLLDRTIFWLTHFSKSQMSTADTMEDFLNGIIGGSVAFLVFSGEAKGVRPKA